MRLIRLVLTLAVYFTLLSCSTDTKEMVVSPNPVDSEQDDTKEPEEEEDDEPDDEKELYEPAEGKPSAALSSCSLENNILFDAPVNNNVQEVNLSEFDMGDWQLVDELSDEFDYAAGKTASVFLSKWKFGFINNYTGPAPTEWSGDQITFETLEGANRAIVLTPSEVGTGANRTLKCGMISSKAKSSYPIFQEAKVKISNSQLANAVWMLSGEPGTTEEIDNLEAYGPRLRPDNTLCDYPYYADRIHLSHHTFKSVGGERMDYQPKIQTWMSRKKTEGDCSRDNEVVWSQDYHYFGVKWVNEQRLEYFVDGKRVKVVTGLRVADGIDPESYTACNGLTREMHMIISQAAQAWRYGGATNFWNSSDIKTGPNTKMYVDWIRVYSPTGNVNSRSCD
ncbi:LamG domain-containing protein [Wenyingzhuangia aestuarii]|uniref:hypothetical protein n=1 Tax=Wenyingzhuangia aestuarii TaxID=1647582 RepID=UPI00143B4A1B|nr:hypothetical protein [Wenyingzhuangia aestuarii]NJB83499.1 agarase [Wenyingzhuangia aestuarii]